MEQGSAGVTASPEESQRGSALADADSIGILHHPRISDSQRLSEEIAGWLVDRGYDAWQGSGWDEPAVQAQVSALSLLITLGGDGTILRAARMAARHRVPILGVNMGRLGFLAESRPEQWQMKLEQVLKGEYWLEKRMMLSAGLSRNTSTDDRGSKSDDPPQVYDALNDIVISRGRLARVIRLAAEIDGDHVTTYQCDGLIVSTATGCTAYALSCGGPILPPELRSILLVPIAPHLSLDRSIVLAEGAIVSIHVSTDHAAILTADGQTAVDLTDGDRVVVQAGPHSGLFVRTQGRDYFYRTLMSRLGGSRYEEGRRVG